MTLGSLFSGIGGIDLAFARAGLEVRWQVEIDRQARSVLARHWPDVSRHEDVRTVGKHNLARVDVIAGGFPCQDLSVAGKRAGIAGDRSGLFWEMVRITDELRPRFLVWENVPGLYSSDAGRDLARVLRGLADIGYFGAWRTLDARFFGVPQRRRRVFGVFARGRAGAERCAEILSLATGLPGHLEAGDEARQDVAACLRGRSSSRGVSAPGRGGEDDGDFVAGTLGGGGAGRGWSDDTDRMTFVAGTLSTWAGNASRQAGANGNLTLAACDTSREGKGPDSDATTTLIVGTLQASGKAAGSATQQDAEAGLLIAHTLTSSWFDASEDGTGRGTPIIPIDMRQASRGETMTNNRKEGQSGGAPGTGIGEDGDPSPTVCGSHVPAVATAIRTAHPSANGHGVAEDVAHTLDVANGQAVMCFQTRIASNGRGQPSEVAHTLTSSEGGSHADSKPHVAGAFGVRRLTPLECERLQGFPDGWTALDEHGKPIADGPRYRMLGNAVAVPCVEWIARRIPTDD